MAILRSIIEDSACPECREANVTLCEKPTERKGLSHRLSVNCEKCGYEKKYYTSVRINTTGAKKGGASFEVNLRFLLAMRTVGKGFADMENFCGIMKNVKKKLTKN